MAINERLLAVARKLVTDWPEYDGDPETDLNISGAEMVDYVGELREECKEILNEVPE